MQDEVAKLNVLINCLELAIGRLFETASGGAQAKALFVGDLKGLLDNTNELQPDSPAAKTYEALLRRLGAADAQDGSGLGVVPTPEQGAPPVRPGV